MVGSRCVCPLVIAFTLLASGCDEEESAPPDPPGTVTTNLFTQGYGNHGIDFETGQVVAAQPGTGFGSVLVDVNLADYNFLSTYPGSPAPGTIADVGSVAGLGDVEDIPSAGFVAGVAAVLGHGYVIQTSEGNYYRMYCDDALTSGGVVGYVIKWAVLPPPS